MSSFVEQLNLTPQERRIVIIIAVVVIGVLNALLVWPRFSDLGGVKSELAKTREEILKENKELLKDNDTSSNGYKVVLKRLQRQQGGGIGNQQIQLQRTVSDQAIKTGVNVDQIRPLTSSRTDTNSFYEEQSVQISFECKEVQLVNFLYNVANDPAMIRVQELSLKPADNNRYTLKGDAILIANYAKQQAATAAPAKAAAPSATQSPPSPGGPPRPAIAPSKGPNPHPPITPKLAPAAQKNL